MLYLSLIEPYLTYCCIAWASPEKATSLKALYKLQKRAAKLIMFVHHLLMMSHYLENQIYLIYMTYANVKF